MKLRSYPKVWSIGHPNVRELFAGDVVVQEKVDGSQFSFGVVDGELAMRSKGAEVYRESVDSLFKPAIATAVRLADAGLLPGGVVYRGEALYAPKHNTLAYGRAPFGGVILYDVDRGLEDRMRPAELAEEAARVGLEVVPTIFEGRITAEFELLALMERESCLGGPMEGLVVKRFDLFGMDGKQVMAKYVTEQFKERNDKEFRKANPSRGDVLETVCEALRTEARWEKAVQRLRDEGRLESSPRDIGALIAEVGRDVLEEEEAWVKEKFWQFAKKHIPRAASRGLPEWYKQRLLGQQFDEAAP